MYLYDFTSSEGFRDIEPLWQRFTRHSSAHPVFSSPQWVRGMLEHRRDRGCRLICRIESDTIKWGLLVEFRDGSLVSAGSELSDYPDLVCSAQELPSLREVLAAVGSRATGSIAFDMEARADSAIGRMVHRDYSDKSDEMVQSPASICYSADTASGWSTYLGRRSLSTRRMVRRIELLMEKEFLTVRASCDPADSRRVITQFLTMHLDRRHGLGRRSVFDQPSNREFLADIGPGLIEAGLLTPFELSRHGEPLGVLIALSDRNALGAWSLGFSPSVARLSPGTTLLIHSLKAAADSGIRLDLMRGAEGYKRRWADSASHTVRFSFALGAL